MKTGLELFYRDPVWVGLDGYDDGLTDANSIRYGGKWVVYCKPWEVEDLVERAKPELGKTLLSLKHSIVPVSLTDRSPPDMHAIVMYCNHWTRRDARKALERRGFSELEWISDIYALKRELKNGAYFNFFHAVMEPALLIELGDIAGVDMKPYVEDTQRSLGVFKDKLEEGLRELCKREGVDFDEELKRAKERDEAEIESLPNAV